MVAARVAGPLTTDNQLMTLFNTATSGALEPEVVATQRLRYFLIFFLFFYCIVLYCIVLHFLFWQWGLTHTMYTQGSGEEPQGVAGRAAGKVVSKH